MAINSRRDVSPEAAQMPRMFGYTAVPATGFGALPTVRQLTPWLEQAVSFVSPQALYQARISNGWTYSPMDGGFNGENGFIGNGYGGYNV